jgi:glycosyltransferase involved in cell wall biosynthesis
MRAETAAPGARIVEQSRIHRRRILVVPSEYPDPADPRQFNGNWAEEQVRAVAAYHDLAVVYPLMTEGRSWIEECDFHNVRTVTVHYRHVRKTWTAPHVAATWRGLRYVRPELRPECIHAHGLFPAGFAAVLVGRTLRIPVVVTEHWGQLDVRIAEGGRLIRNVLKFTLRNATRVVAVSRFLAKEMRELEPRVRVSVVPNVIGPDFLDTEVGPSPRVRDHCELLFVGSIRDNRKGLEELLRAMQLYRATSPKVSCRVTIIGDGRKRNWFEDLAVSLGLGDTCRFVGNQTRDEVAKAMQDCDVFIMPSKYETFGVVYAEAMACGKPVIACTGGAAEEIVPPWAGVLVKPSDTVALARAIEQVVSNLEHYNARRIADHARQVFGPQAVAEAISSVYEQAILGAGSVGTEAYE